MLFQVLKTYMFRANKPLIIVNQTLIALNMSEHNRTALDESKPARNFRGPKLLPTRARRIAGIGAPEKEELEM